jgi:hypothetical protein
MAAGIEADVNIPTLSAKYALEAAKIKVKKIEMTTTFNVISGKVVVGAIKLLLIVLFTC